MFKSWRCSREVVERGLHQASLHGRVKGTTGQSIPDWKDVDYMIYENFKVSGTGESLLDFNDLQRVQLKYDNVQGFHTKWDGSTSLHDKSEEIFRKCYKSSAVSAGN